MRTLNVFDNISLDGYFTDANNDMSWAHQHSDDEWRAFASANAGLEAAMLFGRVTYQQMASFWPTPQAAQQMPAVAAGMNAMPKYVVSRTLARADWQNTTLLKGDLVGDITALKAADGPDLVILGSGSLVSQLTAAGLIDGYQLVVNPIAVGTRSPAHRGRTLFEALERRIRLRLTRTRPFGNGNVVLWYEPA